MDKNSLLYWYPKIKNLGVPTPKTEIVLLNDDEKQAYYRGEDCFDLARLEREIKRAISENFSLPVFLRTDEFSNKHFWKRSCYLNSLQNLREHLFEIISGSRLADFLGGLPIEAIIVREYIEMDFRFRAFFGEMPVNPERRYFVRDGKVECHHPYWTEDAIGNGTAKDKLPFNWKKILSNLNFESQEELNILNRYSITVANTIQGYWSIDYCKAKNGRWILIDMAEGDKSWHPSCRYSNVQEMPKQDKHNLSSIVRKKD